VVDGNKSDARSLVSVSNRDPSSVRLEHQYQA
jgi:hypothetical protein